MRNIITYNNYNITDDQLYGGVSFSHKVNKDTDIHYGVIASAEISFITNVNIPLGATVEWKTKMMQYNAFVVKGRYTITSKERVGRNFKYTAYDKIINFDADATLWLKTYLCDRTSRSSVIAASTLPLDNLLTSIIAYIAGEDQPITQQYLINTGYNYNLYEFLNVNKWCEPMPPQTQQRLQVNEINKMPQYTFRQLLTYLCELMCINIQERETNGAIYLESLALFPYTKK